MARDAPSAPLHDRAARSRANRHAILAMIGGMACFIVNDALVKYVSQTLPAAQLIFVRTAIAAVLLLAVAVALRTPLRFGHLAHGWVAVRTVADTLATLLYLVALFHLPIASATAINMTSPLMITLLAVWLLRARVGPALWLATGAGFLGVVLIVQPGVDGFNVYALVCLLSAGAVAWRDLVTQRVHAEVPTILVTLSTALAVTLVTAALLLLEGWAPMRAAELGMLAVAAAFLAGAYILVITSMRHSDLWLVAPFRYSLLLFSLVLGYVVWSDVPNTLAWCGVVLVIGSGIYVVRANRLPSATTAAID